MNFLHKCKRSDGFTLVELIVVIAILAILAGVAVPAYTGYIKKAEEAADNQLLGAVNTAFAAACLENGIATQDVTKAAVTMGGTNGAKTVTGVGSVSLSAGTADVAKIDAAFKRYYAGNETATFKVFNALSFKDGSFVGGAMAEVYSGLLDTLLATPGMSENITNLNNSTFMTADDLGTEGLLNKVADVTDFASALLGSDDPNAFADIMGGDAYKQFLAGTLGIENASSLTGDALNEALDAKLVDMDLTEDQAMNVLSNGAVLYAAQNTSSMDYNSVVTMLGDGNGKDNILTTLGTNSGDAIAQAALAYGMYTSYVYSLADNYVGPNGETRDDMIDKTNDPLEIMKSLGDAGFVDYINNDPQSAADAAGYLSALTMVNSSVAGSQDAATDVLVNGFNNSDMVALLGSLTGK